jgi:hypothetical protein
MKIGRINMYKCPSCKEIKPGTEFHKSSKIKRGLQYYCKICINRMSEERRQKRIAIGPTVIRDSKICAKCKTKKPISQFGIYRSAADGHVSYCKPCWVTITQKAQAKQRRI